LDISFQSSLKETISTPSTTISLRYTLPMAVRGAVDILPGTVISLSRHAFMEITGTQSLNDFDHVSGVQPHQGGTTARLTGHAESALPQ
jgi:hypothetical protein